MILAACIMQMNITVMESYYFLFCNSIIKRLSNLFGFLLSVYHISLQVSTMFGLRLSYQLNVSLETSGNKVIRGYREANGKLFSCLDILFSLIRNSTARYHNFVNCIMKCFSTSSANSQVWKQMLN